MIRSLSPVAMLDATSRSLALGADQRSEEAIAAQVIRRAVSALAPCSRAEALRFAREPLAGLIFKEDEWFEAVLDGLIAYGDVLEVTPQDPDAWRTSRLVLRPAPPSFVKRDNGDVILLGVAGDQPTAVLGALAERVLHRGPLRTLVHPLPEGTLDLLRSLGLVELPEATWLRAPATASAQSFADATRSQLLATDLSTAPLDGLVILDPSRPVEFYSGRWRPPEKRDAGIFVARREQAFSQRPWCLVELAAGAPRRMQDLVASDDRQRPCDLAWRIQAAFDAAAGAPQRIRTVTVGSSADLEFFSPIPAFAERRLAIKGDKVARAKCLFAYSLPASQTARVLAELADKLWLAAFN
jgi:hypothetical protein